MGNLLLPPGARPAERIARPEVYASLELAERWWRAALAVAMLGLRMIARF